MVIFLPYGAHGGYDDILPIFYNKKDKKFYGLFVHRKGESELTMLGFTSSENCLKYVLPSAQAELQRIFGTNLFGSLFKDVIFDEKHILEFQAGGRLTIFMIPIFNFVPETTLNKQLQGDEINDFVWLDIEQYHDEWVLKWLSYGQILSKGIMLEYKNKMEGLPAKNIPLETKAESVEKPARFSDLSMMLEQLETSLLQLARMLE